MNDRGFKFFLPIFVGGLFFYIFMNWNVEEKFWQEVKKDQHSFQQKAIHRRLKKLINQNKALKKEISALKKQVSRCQDGPIIRKSSVKVSTAPSAAPVKEVDLPKTSSPDCLSGKNCLTQDQLLKLTSAQHLTALQ